jgi:hypothetical protein
VEGVILLVLLEEKEEAVNRTQEVQLMAHKFPILLKQFVALNQKNWRIDEEVVCY